MLATTMFFMTVHAREIRLTTIKLNRDDIAFTMVMCTSRLFVDDVSFYFDHHSSFPFLRIGNDEKSKASATFGKIVFASSTSRPHISP